MTLIVDPTGLDTETHLVLHFFMKYSDRSGYCYYDMYDAARELVFHQDNIVYCTETLVDLNRLVQKQGKKGDAYVVLLPCQCSREVVRNDGLAWRLLTNEDRDMHSYAVGTAYRKGPKPPPTRGDGPGRKPPMQDEPFYAPEYAPDNVIRGVFPTDSDDFSGPAALHVDWCGPVQDCEEKNFQPSWAKTLVSGGGDFQGVRKWAAHLTQTDLRGEAMLPEDDKRQPQVVLKSPHTENVSASPLELKYEDRAKPEHTLVRKSLPSVLEGSRIVRRKGVAPGPDTAMGLALYFQSKAKVHDPRSENNLRALAGTFAKDRKFLDAEPIRRSIDMFFRHNPKPVPLALWRQYIANRRALQDKCNKPYETEKYRLDRSHGNMVFGSGDYRQNYANGSKKLS